jgi:predicted  nucleic acid-binding Zn-ribbon protein
MERTEGFDSQKSLADEAVLNAKSTLDRERTKAAETIDQDKQLLAAVEEKRKAERAEIDEAALSVYDRISKAKGTAVAEALNQKCMACQMMLRPQRWNDLRDRDNDSVVMTCESCGRLLYYDPARDSPQRKPVAVESIAASIIRSL